MTLPNLVSFSGYPKSGKDAAADLLVQRVRFSKTYMLKPLEKILLTIDPWIVDHKEGTIERFSALHESLGFDDARDFEETQRLIQLGTEYGRALFGQNLWTNLVFEEVTLLLGRNKNVALSGVIYKDELDLVRKNNGVSVWIERKGARLSRSLMREDMVTPDDCDIVVTNNGTLRELYINLLTALEEFNTEEK